MLSCLLSAKRCMGLSVVYKANTFINTLDLC